LQSWLATADSYIKNNMAASAKPYLQKIVDQYGDTDWPGPPETHGGVK
jgi:hypothetical protein